MRVAEVEWFLWMDIWNEIIIDHSNCFTNRALESSLNAD
jgi:hypothetical protein